MDPVQRRDSDVQRQIDELRERANASDARADKAALRADDGDARGDKADARADAAETRADDYQARIRALEARADINEQVIAALQAEGMINHDHAVHLSEALRSSRMIGAAIGIVMATSKVSEVEAFAILNRASQNGNRRLRVLADEVVSSGDASGLVTG